MKNKLLLLSLLGWLGLLSLPFTARAAAPTVTTLAASSREPAILAARPNTL